ncbi:MAG: DEAD/DEAH box helicase [Alphaproteobacteria bacterium]
MNAEAFAALGLSEPVVNAVADSGYQTPTPIQAQAIPQVLIGRDVLGCAQTGTGKTASFVLPMIDILSSGRARARMPRSLILEPTRELAAQVSENFVKYGKYQSLSFALLIGGVSFDEQEKKLDRGVDVLIATPGRLLDHTERGGVILTAVKLLVIDEADRMLDMGFIPDIERIVSKLPKSRQTLFFSATMPPEIRRLADSFLVNPREITVDPPSSTATTIEQFLVPYQGRDREKRAALRAVIDNESIQNGLVFCNRKRDVGVVFRSLKRHGYNAGELHGDMAQESRMATLDAFKRGEIQLLVASDVAARGLDIAAVSHVINYDAPVNAEDYVHRIGRTGRAGRSGRSLTIVGDADAKHVQAIEKLIGRTIPAMSAAGEALADVGLEAPAPASRRRRRGKADAAKEAAPREEKSQAPRRRDEAPAEGRRSRRGSEERPQRGAEERPQRGAEQRSRRGGEDRQASEGGPRSAKGESRRRTRGGEDEPEALQGFGDHVPAFLLIPLPELGKDAKGST